MRRRWELWLSGYGYEVDVNRISICVYRAGSVEWGTRSISYRRGYVYKTVLDAYNRGILGLRTRHKVRRKGIKHIGVHVCVDSPVCGRIIPGGH